MGFFNKHDPPALPETLFGHVHKDLLIKIIRPLVAYYNPTTQGLHLLLKPGLLKAVYPIEREAFEDEKILIEQV
jgi:hypothetical protein